MGVLPQMQVTARKAIQMGIFSIFVFSAVSAMGDVLLYTDHGLAHKEEQACNCIALGAMPSLGSGPFIGQKTLSVKFQVVIALPAK
ncbi:hypothetical protein [Candidatus Magnetaquicoccus inordinatus]|uniref:hypothetical protein n=1 Tax=Candidatus Magnetaquicoccus inordinatus TaxID=2496818 RepID=UPI00187D6B06|nr:hypothetical protein [Candidatus Magnetaquicoccus inordinatus]